MQIVQYQGKAGTIFGNARSVVSISDPLAIITHPPNFGEGYRTTILRYN